MSLWQFYLSYHPLILTHNSPVTIKDCTSPVIPIPGTSLDVFELFFSDDLQTKVVAETNLYAKQVMGEDKYRKWKEITTDELKAFYGFSILMGIDQLPLENDYWSRDPLLHYLYTCILCSYMGEC